MESSILKRAEEFILEKMKRKRWQKIVAVLAAFVILVTVWILLKPATATTKKTYCELEEHTHIEECYERTLICEKAGTEDDSTGGSTSGGSSEDSDSEDSSSDEESGDSDTENSDTTEPGTSTEGNDTTDGTNSGTSTEGGNQSGTTNPEETGGSTSDKDGASTDTSGTPEGGDTSSGGTENSGGSSDTSSPAGGSSVGGDSSTGGESSGGGDTSTGGDVSGGASSGGESAPAPSVDVAPSGDVAPVDGGVSSLYNIPATDSKQFVQVSLAHYLSDGTQGTEAESGTVGNTGAGDVMSGDGQVGGELPAGMEEEHVHTDDCYEKKLTCELEEHTHEAICYIDPALPQEDKDRILYAASLIDALPEHEEIMEILAGYEESGDEEGYQSYFQEIAEQALRAYACFEDLGVLQQYIRNKEKVLMLSNLWETMTLDIPDGKSLTVKGINIASWSMNSTGVILFATQIPNDTNFSFWYAFYLTPDEDEKVYQITRIDGIGAAQGGKKPPTNGLILLIHEESHKEVCSTTKVGDYVELDFDYRNCLDGVKNEGYGTVTIGSDYKDPEAKEVRNNELPTIPAASTADLIEINLYDYTYESGDLHINKKYNMTFKESYPYPGFNNPARGSSDMGTNQNFGDLIVSDIDVSEAKVNDKEIANGINERYLNNREPYKGAASSGNLPISVQLDVMSKELQDGYPALIDGTSLAYLFGGEEVSYVKRQNQDGLDGLFQYNEKTGWYTFNSCANHAQFNAEENRFDLYNQVISSNFGIYPFGNFLPFNDIQQAMQASAINKDYYQKMVNDTAYKLQNETDEGHKKEYKRLKDGLEDYIRKMDEKKGENNWTGADVVNDVFEGLASTSWSDIGGFEPVTDNDIDYIYSIDFDDPTNFYFGMSMELDFIQPKDGIVIPPSAEGNGNASNMVFRFVGDDDVWVYIDGKLILDLSGIHRDVGGEIDFVNGEVSYYKLDRSYYKPAQKEGNVDLNVDPVKTVKFSELFSPDQLNEKGTLKDNSTHSMNFYYMERGSGSGVCRMEFNFPLLEKNSFAVGKELSVNNVEVEDLLGHPDFKFQVLEAEKQPDGTMVKPAPDQEKFFITAGMEYSVYREGTVCQNKEEGHVHTANCTLEVTIGEGKKKTYADSGETRLVDENHIFRLKAGEYAIFSGISVVNNGYYVRELLESDLFEQYGEISVSGEAATEHNSISIGKESFEGVESGIKNILEGDTIFYFDNKVDVTKLSELSITKEVDGSEYSKQNEEFLFKVKLGENWLEVGTPYTVSRAVSGGGVELSSGSAIKYLNCGEAHEHASSCYIGVISLKHGETATLEKILAGTEYWIQEIESEGYAVTYKIASPIPSVTDENNKYIPRIVIVDGKQDHVEGITSVKYKPIQIIVVNRESGEVSPPTEIPLTIKKELRNSDGKEHIYRFKVEKVADFEGTPFEEGTTTNDILSNCYELEIKIPAEGETNGEAILHLEYSSDDFPDLKKGESTFRYFKITESVPEDSEEASPEAAATTIFDKTVYVMELKITRTDRKEIKVEYSRIHQGDGEGNWTVEECDGEFPFTFTNEIQSDLIIGKWVNGNIAENEEFTFTVTLSGSAITTEEMSFPYTTGKIESLLETGAENDHSSSITFASGIGTVTLKSGEYFKLYGLPYGISWRVEEQEPENGQKYHISYLLNSHLWGKTDALYATERIEESVASGALLLPEVTGGAIDNAVTFVNTTSYSLPETGSFHTKLLYTLAGVSLVLVACLLYRKNSKKGGYRFQEFVRLPGIEKDSQEFLILLDLNDKQRSKSNQERERESMKQLKRKLSFLLIAVMVLTMNVQIVHATEPGNNPTEVEGENQDGNVTTPEDDQNDTTPPETDGSTDSEVKPDKSEVSPSERSHEITIIGKGEGHTYEAYQVFQGRVDKDGDGEILSDIKWGKSIPSNNPASMSALQAELWAYTASNGEKTFEGAESAEDIAKAMNGAADDGELANAFAGIIANYLLPDPVASSNGSKKLGEENFEYTITVPADGYYFIKDKATTLEGTSEAYTKYILEVIGDREVIAKADTPKIDKTIVEKKLTCTQDHDHSEELGCYTDESKDHNNVSIGDKIKFQVTSNVPKMDGYQHYYFVVTDTMSEGLDFNAEDLQIVISGTSVTLPLNVLPDTDPTTKNAVTLSTEAAINASGSAIGTKIKIIFRDFIQYKEFAGASIIITYSATLNEKAIIGVEGNTNKVDLTYSNDPQTPGEGDEPKPGDPVGKTPEETTYTYVTGIRLEKVDTDKKPLEGAKFVLEGEKANIVLVKKEEFVPDPTGTYYKLNNNTYTVSAPGIDGADPASYAGITVNSDGSFTKNDDFTPYKLVTNLEKQVTTSTVSAEAIVGADGIVRFDGLSEGTYTITELVAPDGYNILKEPLIVKIKWVEPTDPSQGCTWTATVQEGEEGSPETLNPEKEYIPLEVINKKGTTLPSTGGMGTTIFYAVGSILVLGAAIILIAKKRANVEK